VTVLLDLGNDYYIAQRYRDAGQAFREALGLRPKDIAAQIRLAMVWHAQGLTSKAISTLQAVLEASPSSQDAHYSLAILFFSQDQVTKARDQWAAAARIDPRSTIGRRSQNFVDLLDGKESAPTVAPAPQTASTPQGGFGSQSQGERPARGD
jgi:Tfp pilus assembly protein PilF